MVRSFSKGRMRTNLRVLTIATLLVAAGVLRADLITNGSFETPTVTDMSFTEFVPGGSVTIPGWTVVGAAGGVAIVAGDFSQGGISFPAESGLQWLDLTGLQTNSTEGVEQTVATTPGSIYDLSFWVGNVDSPSTTFGTTSTVDVRLGGIDGSLLLAATNDSTSATTQVWQQFTAEFTAAGSTTTLDFLNGDPSNDNTNGLDNVTLTLKPTTTAVPEPGALPLAALVIIALGFYRRRKALLL